MPRRRSRPAAVVTLSSYLEAVLAKNGATLIRDRRATFLTDVELDRLTEEWQRFRAGPSEPDPGPLVEP